MKQHSGRFACPNIDFKLMQKHQKLNYRGTMIQFHHVYLTSGQVVFRDLACGRSEMVALDEMMEFFREKQNTSEMEVSVF